MKSKNLKSVIGNWVISLLHSAPCTLYTNVSERFWNDSTNNLKTYDSEVKYDSFWLSVTFLFHFDYFWIRRCYYFRISGRNQFCKQICSNTQLNHVTGTYILLDNKNDRRNIGQQKLSNNNISYLSRIHDYIKDE